MTGCLRRTPADNLPILTGIQPVELRRKEVILSLACRAVVPWILDICSNLHSPVHRVGMHGI